MEYKRGSPEFLRLPPTPHPSITDSLSDVTCAATGISFQMLERKSKRRIKNTF